MTQHQLADAAGVDLKTIYNLESGTRWPIARNRAAISAALGWEGDALAPIAVDATTSDTQPDGNGSHPTRRPSLPMDPELERAMNPQFTAILARMEVVEGLFPGELPSGARMFPHSQRNAKAWDELLALGWPPELVAEGLAVLLADATEAAGEPLNGTTGLTAADAQSGRGPAHA